MVKGFSHPQTEQTILPVQMMRCRHVHDVNMGIVGQSLIAGVALWHAKQVGKPVS